LIFVTVGMHTQGFDRLVMKMDEIAGTTDEKVIMQIGHTGFRPRNAEWFDFTTAEKVRELCGKARVMVTQPAMSIVDAFDCGTPVVVVPRLKRYKEVINDHQLDLAREIEKQGRVTSVYDVCELEEVLKKAVTRPPQLALDSSRLVNALKEYIARFEQQ